MKNAKKNVGELGLTKQREVVLQVIRGAEEHLTANEVFDRAKQLLPTISFATVYNSLRFLKQQRPYAVCRGKSRAAEN